ncbi:hypothetical protein ACO0SA_003307 [Hanseniaspora valbyensis]
MSYNLKQYLNKNVLVVLSEGEILEGKLIGFDKHLNLTIEKFIIKEQNENETSDNKPVMNIVRGDLIVFLGEVDTEKIYKLNKENETNEKYNHLLNKINDKNYKFYKSTKNMANEREIKTWMKVYQLRQHEDKKRALDDKDINEDKDIKKSKN